MTRLASALLAIAMACLSLPATRAAESENALVFQVTAAVKAHNRAALKRCMNFEGADAATVKDIEGSIDRILSWSSPHVFTSTRKDRGPVEIPTDAGVFTLNGDWTFQIHVFEKAPPAESSGYVFPAGKAGDTYKILLSVPK